MNSRRPMSLLIAAIVGGVFGPIAFFAIENSDKSPEKWDDLFAASELIKSYDRQNTPKGIMFSIALDNPAIDCGYDTKSLFGLQQINPRIPLSRGKTADWNPATGYDDLLSAKMEQYYWLKDFERGRELARQLTYHTLLNLNDCISRTALQSICTAYVRYILEKKQLDKQWMNPPYVNNDRENKTICAYMDGIAARAKKGLLPR